MVSLRSYVVGKVLVDVEEVLPQRWRREGREAGHWRDVGFVDAASSDGVFDADVATQRQLGVGLRKLSPGDKIDQNSIIRFDNGASSSSKVPGEN